MLDNRKIDADTVTECDPHERRRQVRYPFTAAVEIVVRESQTRIQGRTSDLSRGAVSWIRPVPSQRVQL
jgi:hypothetical protein